MSVESEHTSAVSAAWCDGNLHLAVLSETQKRLSMSEEAPLKWKGK